MEGLKSVLNENPAVQVLAGFLITGGLFLFKRVRQGVSWLWREFRSQVLIRLTYPFLDIATSSDISVMGFRTENRHNTNWVESALRYCSPEEFEHDVVRLHWAPQPSTFSGRWRILEPKSDSGE